MIGPDEASRILAADAEPLSAVRVDLAEALGSVLAEDIVADRDFPPTARSAMDGYAVRAADLTTPGGSLRLAGEVRAGQGVGTTRVEPGSTVRIFTGAIVPPGADAVVMVEQTEEDEMRGTVRFAEAVGSGQHIRLQGEELVCGAPLLAAGTTIRAAEIAALTSVGRLHPRVHRRPDVAVLSTGDEVVEPDRSPEPHQVRNSNGWTLMAQLREIGLAGRYLGIATDDGEALSALIREGLTADVLLMTGGVSVGRYDLVGQALEQAGMRQLFHKVAVRPGKPLLAGRAGDCRVFALPGNPVSAFTGFAVFVAPVLRTLMGHRDPDNRELRVTLEEPVRGRPGRRSYHLAEIGVSDGNLTARPVQTRGSGDVLSMVRANGFIITPDAGATLPAGSVARAVLWNRIE